MITNFHFLRPWWLYMILPLLGLAWFLWQQKTTERAWSEICDPHLLAHLLQKNKPSKTLYTQASLLLSLLFMILSSAGPAWYKLPMARYKTIQPRVLVLDMSDHMMANDLKPNRLSRAKFKLNDLFAHKDTGQFALIAFTSEPFVVSPLTDDGKTISALLPSLIPEVMPVSGQDLDSALDEAKLLIKQAGYEGGQILVLTADPPSASSVALAKKLARSGTHVSIMPVRMDRNLNPSFQAFADAGKGLLLKYTADTSDLEQWLKVNTKNQWVLSKEEHIALWRDEGRWFLIPALLLLLPVFQKSWIQRIGL